MLKNCLDFLLKFSAIAENLPPKIFSDLSHKHSYRQYKFAYAIKMVLMILKNHEKILIANV